MAACFFYPRRGAYYRHSPHEAKERRERGMKYDKEKIRENADPVKVALRIGYRWDATMRQNGTRVQILCPCHKRVLGKPDDHFGSCFITKHGTKCYACAGADPEKGGADDVFQMAMDVLGCSFSEAVGIVAETVPDAALYVIDDDLDEAELAELRARRDRMELLSALRLDDGRTWQQEMKSANPAFRPTAGQKGLAPEASFYSDEQKEDEADRIACAESLMGSTAADTSSPEPYVAYGRARYGAEELMEEHPDVFRRLMERKARSELGRLSAREQAAKRIGDPSVRAKKLAEVQRLRRMITEGEA